MDSPAIDTDAIGSAGTLISAGLQTAAHYIQSALLDVVNSSLGSPIASFLFALAMITALITVAVGGNYKFGLWFLIGPALFYTAVALRVPSSGVNWEFGGRVRGQRMVKEITKGVYGDSPSTNGSSTPGNQLKTVGKVSSIFAKWDIFSSAVIQELITATQLVNTKSDLEFITRTDRFAALFRFNIGDGKLQTFLNLVVLDECSTFLSLQHARFHTNGVIKRTDVEKQLASIEKRVVISSQDQDYHFIQDLYNNKYFGPDAPPIKDSYTCQDLWDLATRALKIEAQELITTVASAKTSDDRTPGEIQKELSKKFQSLDEKKAGAKTEAEKKGFDEEKVDIMLNAAAVRMFHDAMKNFQRNRAHPDLGRDLRAPDGEGHYNTAEDIRHLADNNFEYDVKGQYLQMMLALPYIQGLILYFLAITYPFFAFALVVPGRHHAALLWLGLWFWAKSWDFGFAVVMLFDEILYYLLPHGPPMTKELMADPGKAFQVLFQADPTYSVFTYYQIMATLLAAIPILTGLLVKRGASDIFNTVSRGYHEFAGKLGSALASFSRSLNAQAIAEQEEGAKIQAGEQAIAATLQDPEFLRAVALGGGVKMLEAIGDQLTRQGTPNLVSEFVRNLGTGVNTAVNQQQLNLAVKKLQANVALAMWDQSHSDESRDAARREVMLKFYIHGQHNPPPIRELVDLEIARRLIPWGGPVAGAADRLVNDAIDQTFSVKRP